MNTTSTTTRMAAEAQESQAADLVALVADFGVRSTWIGGVRET